VTYASETDVDIVEASPPKRKTSTQVLFKRLELSYCFILTMTAPTVKSTDDINDFLSYLETPSPRCLSANNSVVASPTTMSPTTMSPTTMSPNNATDITEEEVRALFDLWNSALATGDSRIVARRYTKVSYVLSLSLSRYASDA